MPSSGGLLRFLQRDERVQETAMLYGIGPLQEAAAKWKSKREFTSDKPVPKSLGPVNAFQSIKGWTPQVKSK